MSTRGSMRWSWPLAAGLALVLAAVPTPTTAAPPAANLPSAVPAAAGGTVLTLVTGDQVALATAPGGELSATVEPAPRPDGQQPTFETVSDGTDLYLVPSDAAPLIPDTLDRELFNVSKLARYGYTAGTPVVVAGTPAGRSTPASTGLSVTASLSSIDGFAATVRPDGAWWRTATATSTSTSTATGPAPAAAALAGATGGKVWLDELTEVALAESAPLVGAPQAWAAGFDGTGRTVAVLDTGIDGNHPDLAGKVVAAENFTTDPDTRDENGHGTHVSGILAGTGVGSDGTFRGVAPGAELMSGKVCNSAGSCPTSGLLAGMEWAAARADLVSVSIGTQVGTDGTDPLSQAVNSLTAQHDTLFVIASGNAGAFGDGSVGSPGAADAALTVGSVDKSEQLAGSSSRGPRLGDFAIKPDLTAPGVSIVSARGAGTSLGTPVNELYTTASGTSMATPHVAGAAAILLQQDPNLSAAEVKAALATTAVPNPSLEVYQQGGGRLDIPSALAAPVRATPSPLNLGYFPYPQDGTAPESAEVTYTNRTDAPVSLDLSLEVESRDGAVPAAGMLSVSPTTLAVPAGGTATATVTVDPRLGEVGLYGGYLVAGRDGEPATRTPVGFHKEPERYELAVTGIARDGRPARGSSALDVINVQDTSQFLETSVTFVDGVATVRVPPGTYHVMGQVYTYDGHDQFFQNRTMVGDPEVEVTADTSLVLDARDGVPVEVDTPEHPSAGAFGTSRIAYHRAAAQRGTFTHTWSGDWLPNFAMPTEQVTVGGFEYYARLRLGELPLTLDLVDPQQQALHPRQMSGSAPVDGEQELPLVFAGFGAPEEYQGIDAEGAAVLTVRGGPNHASKEATARANGAAALLVMNDTVGNYAGSAGTAAQLPVMTIPGEEGEQLRDLLATGPVTVRVAGTPVTPFLYDVVFPEPGNIPDELSYTADPDDLATLENAYHSGVTGQVQGEVRHSWRPYELVSLGLVTGLPAPQQRTELLTTGDTRYAQRIDALRPFVGTLLEPVSRYQPGQHREQSWFQSPLAPGVIEGGTDQAGTPVVRSGDTLSLAVPEWVDASRHWGLRHTSVDTTAFRLFQDGELVAEAARPSGDFPLSPQPASYRLEVDVSRTADWWPTSTATRTAWTVESARPPAGQEAVLPVLLVDYQAELDLTNTAPRRLLPTLDLAVRHQPGADGARIAGARVSVSYDDGDSWHRALVLPRGGGEFTAILLPVIPPADAEFASLRVEAWDRAGNRIEQEVTRAWALSGRG
ncbi:MAG: S8 family serine peptidase [Micromonosporaceae bacterium]|nr:S8 family serine peptidase [Micromonosporaceae bacterium]